MISRQSIYNMFRKDIADNREGLVPSLKERGVDSVNLTLTEFYGNALFGSDNYAEGQISVSDVKGKRFYREKVRVKLEPEYTALTSPLTILMNMEKRQESVEAASIKIRKDVLDFRDFLEGQDIKVELHC